jgi:hypothetical protein
MKLLMNITKKSGSTNKIKVIPIGNIIKNEPSLLTDASMIFEAGGKNKIVAAIEYAAATIIHIMATFLILSFLQNHGKSLPYTNTHGT